MQQNNTFSFENIDVFINKNQEKEINHLPFLNLKDEILGCDYELSVSFVTKSKALQLNKKFKSSNYVPNTLSFPYSEKSGEIILQLETIYEQSPNFQMDKKMYLLFIIIHSLLHLKGYDHGSKMDNLEKKFLKKYKLSAK